MPSLASAALAGAPSRIYCTLRLLRASTAMVWGATGTCQKLSRYMAIPLVPYKYPYLKEAHLTGPVAFLRIHYTALSWGAKSGVPDQEHVLM